MTRAANSSLDPTAWRMEATRPARSGVAVQSLPNANVKRSAAKGRTTRTSRRLATRVGAVSIAALLHLAIVLAIGLSLRRTELRFQTIGGGGGAILASLTPAAALSSPPSSHAEATVDDLARVLNQAVTTVPEPSKPSAHGSDVLAELDGGSSPATPKTARAEPSNANARGAAVRLGDADNPWAHASAAALDVDKTQEFWAAVKRCWRGEVDEGRASIRVVLDSQGEVQSMSAMGEAGQARSAAEALAAAVGACAPYRLGAAGAYLVTGPS